MPKHRCALCGAFVKPGSSAASTSFKGAGLPSDDILHRLFGLRARSRESAYVHDTTVSLTLDNGSSLRGNCYRMCLKANTLDSTRRGTRDTPATSYIAASSRAPRQSELEQLTVCLLAR